jgi:regulator of protease activity HflC (stomatin/prohibitin superfamily)
LIKGNHKGVISQVLKSGTHRLNPFTHSVMLMNTRSQRHEFSGNDAITFLTLDGFTVSLEGTVEFNINEKLAPRLVQVVGDMNDILKKIILPSVHGFARIEGSKKGATEFIIGESRRLFQEELDKFLRKNCAKWGIVINSVLIRDIIVPQQIAEIIRKRELALQDARKYTQEITRAKSEAELAKQKTLAEQNKKKVAAETERLTAKIAAEQKQVEAVMAAQADLDVAKIDYETAKSEAKSVLNAAVAQSAVIKETKAKEAEVLARMVKAFGSGENFITGKIYEKIMPGINSIVLNSNNSSANSFGLPLLNNKKMEVK